LIELIFDNVINSNERKCKKQETRNYNV